MNHYPLFLFLIESSLCVAMLYFIYKYILYRFTYFSWNRYYLIAAAVVSLLIPLVHLPFDIVNASKWGIYKQLVEINTWNNETLFSININQFAQKTATHTFQYLTFFNFLLIIYFSGIFRYSIELSKKLRTIFKLIRTYPKHRYSKFYLVETQLQQSPFTFLRYIFVGKSYTELSDEKKMQILKHEEIHAQQWHTFDVLFFEIVTIVLWFNPWAWKMKNTLREIHEYIADHAVVNNRADAGYSRLLLQMSMKQNNNLLSSFSVSQLKQRISLLMAPESDSLRKLRFVATMPLVLVLLLLFSFTKEVFRSAKQTTAPKENAFIFPVKSDFKIVQPFYVNKKISDFSPNKYSETQNYGNVRLSHQQISIQTPNYTEVLAAAKGVVANVSKWDNWGVYEYTIEIEHNKQFRTIYKKLYKIYCTKGDSVLQAQIIGKTGDVRIFPVFCFKMIRNKQAIDPLKYVEY